MPLHGRIDFLMSKTETTTLSATLNVIWHYESDHIKSKLKYRLKIMCPPWTYRLPNHQKPRLQHSTLNVIWHCKSDHIKSKKVSSEFFFLNDIENTNWLNTTWWQIVISAWTTIESCKLFNPDSLYVCETVLSAHYTCWFCNAITV